ncbi:MAG: MFS transporter [Rhodothermales bacterium]
MTETDTRSPELRKWQTTTMLSLVVGYAGYYFCRSNFSVASPLLLEAFGDQGLDKEMLGAIASVGVFFYAIGKLLNGVLCDFVGGRRMFLFGMAASIGATVLFGTGVGISVFFVAWAINRLVQSMGWGALVKISSNWFSYKRYGWVMGIMSLSFLFGDAIARLFLGKLIGIGFSWQGVFFASAAVLGVIAVVDFFTLKSSPTDVGLPEVEVNPKNVFGDAGERERPPNLMALLLPFFRSPAFWLVAFMSFGLTLMREAFNFWTPTYLAEVGQLSAGDAGQLSLFFPLFGGFAVLLTGYLSDKMAGGKRAGIMVMSLIPLVAILVVMGSVTGIENAVLPVVFVSISAFLMLGPYAFLAGAISLDLGGKQGSSTAAGMVDSAGYFGSILSGWGVGAVAQRFGWNAVFILLAIVAFLTALAAILYWRKHEA